MNGILALTFWASSFIHPELPLTDGLTKTDVIGRQTLSVGAVQFQKDFVGSEVGFFQASPTSFGPLQPSFAVSVTDAKGLWFGVGFTNLFTIKENNFVSLSFLPGIYDKGEEEDLGGWLMFRSGVEVGHYINSDWFVSLQYDHRSSGDIWSYNPGIETFQFRFGRLL